MGDRHFVHRGTVPRALLALLAVAGLGLGLGDTAVVAQSTAPATAPAIDPQVAELLRLVNAERRRVNAPPLVLNTQLTTAAQGHAADMARTGRLSHTGSNGSTLRSRVDAVRYPWSTIGENVAMGQPTAAAVMASWMNSPGHRQNILNPAFRELGVGRATGGGRPYWVQVFAARR